MEFIECEDIIDLKGNKTRDDTTTGGCYKVHSREHENINLLYVDL